MNNRLRCTALATFALALACTHLPAAGQTYVWSNLAGGAWHNGSSWFPASTPPANADVIFPGTTGYQVDREVSTTVRSISLVNPAATLRQAIGVLPVTAGISGPGTVLIVDQGRLQLGSGAVLAGPGSVVMATTSSSYTPRIFVPAGAPATIGPAAIVEGRMRISGPLRVEGTLAPGGRGVADLSILDAASLVLAQTAVLEFDCGGEGPGNGHNDSFASIATSTVQLGGTLRIRFIGEFRPFCSVYFLFGGATLTGRFDSVDFGAHPGGARVTYEPSRVRVEYIPTDHNRSGAYTAQDIYDFLSDWYTQSAGGAPIIASADFNESGQVTVQDIYDYFDARWGCP